MSAFDKFMQVSEMMDEAADADFAGDLDRADAITADARGVFDSMLREMGL